MIEDSKRAATMAMGREAQVQNDLMGMLRSPGHVFYDGLRDLLGEAGFGVLAAPVCRARTLPEPHPATGG